MLRGTGGNGRRHGVVLVLLAAAACGPDDEEDSPPSCAELADHLARVCPDSVGLVLAERTRVMCSVAANNYGAGVRRCVLGVATCDRDAFEACDFSNVTYQCRAPADCPPPLVCDVAAESCEACLTDSECPADRTCSSAVCLPR